MSDDTTAFETRHMAEQSTPRPTIGALMLLIGDQPGRSLLLDAENVTLGRGEHCDLRFELDGVSRTHAVIYRTPSYEYSIHDHNSTNGVFVNGSRVSDHRLRDGDRIAMGPNLVFSFRVLQLDEALALEGLYVSRARDAVTGAATESFFLELLRLQLELGQRRGFDVAVICLRWKNPLSSEAAEVDQRLRGMCEQLRLMQKPGSTTARAGAHEFVQTLSYVSEQEVDQAVEALVRNLQERFAGAKFQVGVGRSRRMGAPSPRKLLERARQFQAG